MTEGVTNGVEGETYMLRSYQTEIVEASLNHNIIFAVFIGIQLVSMSSADFS